MFSVTVVSCQRYAAPEGLEHLAETCLLSSPQTVFSYVQHQMSEMTTSSAKAVLSDLCNRPICGTDQPSTICTVRSTDLAHHLKAPHSSYSSSLFLSVAFCLSANTLVRFERASVQGGAGP